MRDMLMNQMNTVLMMKIRNFKKFILGGAALLWQGGFTLNLFSHFFRKGYLRGFDFGVQVGKRLWGREITSCVCCNCALKASHDQITHAVDPNQTVFAFAE